jgi:nitrate reductase assembly molybdenum cofactor insertion protein NarJ
MAELKNEYKKYDTDCGRELPDFLPTVLCIIPKLGNEDRKSIIELALIPALDSMLKNFATEGNVYQYPLQILRNILSKEVTCV